MLAGLLADLQEHRKHRRFSASTPTALPQVGNSAAARFDVWAMIRAAAVAFALPVLLAGCGSAAPAAPTVVTVTAPAPAPAPAVPAPASVAAAPAANTPRAAAPTSQAPAAVKLPQVKGRNGAIVYDELQKLGLKHVSLASADKAHTVVLVPQNWTVTKIEPAAGTQVDTDDTVVVTMTKD